MNVTLRFSEAVVYAIRLHGRQQRKASGTPFVAHLLNVAGLVLQYGGTEDQAIAAVLHDAVEDQGGEATAQTIRRRFGPVVAEIVDGCTDATTLPKPPWRPRKEAFLERLRGASPAVRLVKAADALDNCRALADELRHRGAAVWAVFNGGRDGTLWYYRSVAEILKPDGNRLVEELERAVTQLERSAGG